MSDGVLLLGALATPWLGAVLVLLTGSRPNLRETMTLLAASVLFALTCLLYQRVNEGGLAPVVLGEVLPGLEIAFEVEPLGMLFALVASFLWIVTSLYSIGYMRSHHERHQTRFYTCFAVAIAGAMGVAYSANMFSLFLFYELLTLSTYPLVTHAGTPEAMRGGRTYLGVLLSTSIAILLLGIIWTWSLVGTLDFVPGGVMRGAASDTTITLLFALYVFGIGKAALMPFHRWLPAAMVAPTPVSALLHAVAVVKAGVFSIMKVAVYLFGIDVLAETGATRWLCYVAAFTILAGSLVAMSKDNLKARLAYSTISQLSYIVLGTLMVNGKALAGAGMHIAMHAFGKITLFFCAGAILVSAHKTEISQMRGLGRRMPLTMGAFLIGSLCIIGLPPTGGVWSKWFLGLGALSADHATLLLVLMLSSLLSVIYLLPIPVSAFFGSGADNGGSAIKEAPWPCLLAIGVTALGCVALFFFPDPVYRLIEMALTK